MAADNRNFADVLDIQGTEVCLADKKLAETSSETGVQTTDYVLLQDTDGSYHKILKSNFTEAIRNTLAGLLVNNDKGTSVNQIPAIASGDLGSVTPANLASVLGAQDNMNWTARIKGNSTGGNRFYKIFTTSISMPFKFMGRGSANGRHTDTTIVIGKNVHEGYKGLGQGADGDTYLSYFYTDNGTEATLYVRTLGAIQARVISIMPMTEFREIGALPEGAVQITLT